MKHSNNYCLWKGSLLYWWRHVLTVYNKIFSIYKVSDALYVTHQIISRSSKCLHSEQTLGTLVNSIATKRNYGGKGKILWHHDFKNLQLHEVRARYLESQNNYDCLNFRHFIKSWATLWVNAQEQNTTLLSTSLVTSICLNSENLLERWVCPIMFHLH